LLDLKQVYTTATPTKMKIRGDKITTMGPSGFVGV
jgi:hypothetical protein